MQFRITKTMKQFIKITFTLLILLLLTSKSYSQISVSYYNSSLSKIGLGYNFSEKVWGELRLYSNTAIYDVTPEFVVCYNIVQKENHNIYVGLGGVINYFTGFVVPVGVQFIPFEKSKKLSFHIEFQPTLDFYNDMVFQSAWGLRYRFGE